jgi:hypothetical protein
MRARRYVLKGLLELEETKVLIVAATLLPGATGLRCAR